MLNKKVGVCICGLAPTDFNSQYDKWVINDAYTKFKDAKLIFNLHKTEYLKTFRNRFTNEIYFDEISKLDIPVFLQEEIPELDNGIKFPIKELIKEFKTKLFNSTVDYMIAYAIYKGYKNIDIIGINMAAHTEYKHQRPSLFYWIGIAKERNVNVNIKSKLFWNEQDKKLYGYEV